MKNLLFLLFFVCPHGLAGDLSVHLNLGSKHFRNEINGVKLNNKTPGLGLSYRVSRLYLTGGYISHNSFGNESWYGGVGFEAFSSHRFSFGYQGVLASGYEDTPARNGGFVGSATFRVELKNCSIKLHAIGFSAIGLQYQINI